MRAPWRPAATVPARFRAADPSVRRSFVAALWAARGWETRVAGDRVVARGHPQWADATLLVPADGAVPAAVPDDVDAVVTTGPSPSASSVRTVTPADLRRVALYAGDRAAAESACRRHLGVELRADPEAATPGAPLAEVGLVAVAVVVVLAAVFGVVGTAPDPPDTDLAPGAATATPGAERPSLAPGVTDDGLQNLTALASAHARDVDRNQRPYVWRLTYEEYDATEQAAPLLSHNETVWVVDDSRYRVDKNILYGGRVPMVGPLLVSNRAYADGTHRYVRYRLGGHTEFERFPVETDSAGAARFSSRSAELLTLFLDTNESWVRPVEIDGDPYFQLYGSGTPRFDVVRYRVVAFFTDDGFVEELSVTFRDPKTETAVIFTYEYVPFSGTLTPPSWAGRASNVTVGEDGSVVDSVPPNRTPTPTPPDDVETIAMPSATVPNGSRTPTATPTPSPTTTPTSTSAGTPTSTPGTT
jgi:hypothetical protein